MSDKKKQKVKDNGLDDLEDYARQIWLAGLGAYTRLGKEGSKLFDALIREGEDAEKLANKVSLDGARSKVDKARRKLADKLGSWEELLDKRLQDATERMGLARQTELQQLAERVDELTRAVEKLSSAPAAKANGSKAATVKPAAKASTSSTSARTAKASEPAAQPEAKATARKPAKARSPAAASKAPAKASETTGVKTAPRRRTTPRAATRGKTTPAPATDATPGTPPEL